MCVRRRTPISVCPFYELNSSFMQVHCAFPFESTYTVSLLLHDLYSDFMLVLSGVVPRVL